MPQAPGRRLLVAQYGDYRQAVHDRQAGQPETYRAQHYSMDCLEAAVGNGEALIVCLDVPPYDVRHGNLRLVGDRFIPTGRGLAYWLAARRSGAGLVDLARQFRPSHVIIRTPGLALSALGRFALARGVPVLPLFADYFASDTWRRRLRLRPAVSLLNDTGIGLVANHNIPACQSMADAGVRADKIVPYDWPVIRRPTDAPVRDLPDGDTPEVVYAGQISTDKGVPELLTAVALLAGEGRPVRLHLFGDGPERSAMQDMARASGLAGQAVFHGPTPNTHVLAAMDKAAMVVVPSRPAYPEGIPCVISEAFESRAPLVVSDHPAFRTRLLDGRGCLVFPAGDAVALAGAMLRLLADAPLYRALSASAQEAWEAIQCPVTFGMLLHDFLENAGTGRPFAVLRHALVPREVPHA